MPKLLWKIHSCLGLLAGLGLLVIGLSGSVLVFREQMNGWLQPQVFRRPHPALARQPLDTLLRSIERQLPRYGVTGWNTRAEHDPFADEVYLIRYGTSEWLTCTLDPGSGQLLSQPHDYRDETMGWLLEFHYSFLGGALGLAVCLGLSVLLIVLGGTGLYLQRKAWRRTALPWTYDRYRRRLSSLHRWVGMLSSLQFLVLGGTGAIWTYERLQFALHERHQTPEPLPGRLYGPALSLDAVVGSAASHLPGFVPHFISLPSTAGYRHVTLWGEVEPRSSFTEPDASTERYAADTGRFEAASAIAAAPRWNRIEATFKPLHFGRFGGIATRILYCLTGLAPGILGLSGFLVWRHRREVVAPPPDLPAAV